MNILKTAKVEFKSACTKLEKQEYNLVCVDIFLDPLGFVGDGGRLFSTLHARYPDIPVVAITSEPKPIQLSKVRDLFVEYGIDDFVLKQDIDIKKIRDMVGRILEDVPSNSTEVERSFKTISEEISKLSGLENILNQTDLRLLKDTIEALAIPNKNDNKIIYKKIEACFQIIPFFIHWKAELELNEERGSAADFVDHVSIEACENVLKAWTYLKTIIKQKNKQIIHGKPRIRCFISYAHAYEEYFETFQEDFRAATANLQFAHLEILTDKEIALGSNWHEEIQEMITSCDFAILLVSDQFMASEYIKHEEVNRFFKLKKSKNILVVPIHFFNCRFFDWPELAKNQFFKPRGADYGRGDRDAKSRFCYADLIEFEDLKGGVKIAESSPRRSDYMMDFVEKLEKPLKKIADRKSCKAGHPSYTHKSSLHFSTKVFRTNLIGLIKVPFLYADTLKKIYLVEAKK